MSKRTDNERPGATPGDERDDLLIVDDPGSGEEVEQYGEDVIGRAFKWSLVILAVIVAGGAGAFFYLKRTPAVAPQQLTEVTAPKAPPSAVNDIPAVRFTDITAASGITFVHNNGAYGDKLLPESMGGGVAFLDYDADGDPDLFFANSCDWPWHEPAGGNPSRLALYANDGTGRFSDVTPGSGLDVSVYAQGCAVGD
ncbi:MAG: VCBS repeat-containing protein, partial [Verrucomicrobiae bacterium]|nr:VCBS repeat-containing protein [Verrucomicrobiae bacterium]